MMISRINGATFHYINDSHNLSKICDFYELAGGIIILPSKYTYLSTLKKTLYNENINASRVSIIYDGATHFSIEDSDYIYRIDVPYYVEITCKNQDNIYLITYSDKYQHLIVLNKTLDYDELLNIVEDEIEIREDEIVATRFFEDSLGRKRISTYRISGNEYILFNVEFEYTYDIVYQDKLRSQLIADAIYAKDYEYVNTYLMNKSSKEVLAKYFEERLGSDIDIPSIVSLDENIMYFIDNTKIEDKLLKIEVEYDASGKIVNFI